ncbi:MAG TPA: hypothetical protein VHF51_02000 [Solirubrobacteraceae bacterium]|nr:hypothetical protein [Solirubrobacteraceae bacterium]
MEEREQPEPVSERDEEPARRTTDGDIVGGETVGTEDTAMGAGAEADISRGDGGMGTGRGADVDRDDDPDAQRSTP